MPGVFRMFYLYDIHSVNRFADRSICVSSRTTFRDKTIDLCRKLSFIPTSFANALFAGLLTKASIETPLTPCLIIKFESVQLRNTISLSFDAAYNSSRNWNRISL